MNPSPPPVPANSPATASAVLSGAASGCPSGCLTTGCLLGIGLLGGGLLLLLAVPPLGLFGVILGTIVLGATAWAWLSRLQSETLDVALSCAPLRPCLGQEVAFAVTLTGKKSCRLGAGTVTLRCRERAISRGGTSDTTYTHTVYEDTRDLPSVDQLDAGSSWTAGPRCRASTTPPSSSRPPPPRPAAPSPRRWPARRSPWTPGWCDPRRCER